MFFFNSFLELVFIGGLKEFLKYWLDFVNDIVFDSLGIMIIVLRFYFMLKLMFIIIEEGEFM